MSCQMKGIAFLVDPTNIKRLLLENSTTNLEHVAKKELPLQDCCMSMSSAGDVLVLGFDNNLVILTSKWDLQEPGEVKNKFNVSWSGNVSAEPGEFITSILCLPLIALGKSISNVPDWTCIVVGYSSGFVRFYTETGNFLLEEQFHNSTIINLKCQSLQSSKSFGESSTAEEIYVIYSSVICILQGFQLFSTLRACRSHLARIQANCDDKAPTTALNVKKYSFKDQDMINDAEVIGVSSVNTLDHLMTASIHGGFNASYRSSAPQHNLIMAAGKRPFVGFHFALEGGAAPVLTDVALAMANSLANAIGKFTAVPWFKSSKQPSQDKGKSSLNDTPEAMICRFGISDIMREAVSLIISPNKSLSVITDTMGRVILINNRKGIALRMWKGYRDAQCGWIQVLEDKYEAKKSPSGSKKGSSRRNALFLVIYAPKKGVIDIWGIEQGSKITTFSASKNGKLLAINNGLYGINDMINSSMINDKYKQLNCLFIDPLGGIKEINVPFHFALSSKNVKRARDIYLFKKLKKFINDNEYNDNIDNLLLEINNICLELNTNDIKLQILNMFINNKYITPECLSIPIDCFLNNLIKFNDNELDNSGKLLYRKTIQLQKLIEFYNYIKQQFDSPPEYKTVTNICLPNSQYLSTVLLTSQREINRILKLSQQLEQASSTTSNQRVTFKLEKNELFILFISSFDCGVGNNIKLIQDLDDDKKYQIASLIYQGWLYSSESMLEFQEAAQQSNINSKELMELALIYWLNKRPGAPLEIELNRLTELLHGICHLAKVEDEISMEYNESSKWWKHVRSILMESKKPFEALTAALACRSVGITLQKSQDCARKLSDENQNRENGNESDDQVKKAPEEMDNSSEWENISKDTCQFALLIGNLEDVAILDSILRIKPPSDETTSFLKLPFEKTEISLSFILSKGKGSVSEIVAKWLASSGVDPARLIDTSDIEFDQLAAESSSKFIVLNESNVLDLPEQLESYQPNQPVEIATEVKSDSSALRIILDQLTILKRHFPYSLTSSVLLANLSWQFVMYWSKEITRLDVLATALSILRQIPMKFMKHGVCCLLWNIHLKKKMESAAKLINKLGKLPKERLCNQEIGLSDIQSVVFLQHCVTFLDIFLDCEINDGDSPPVIKTEELWTSFGATGPQSFASLAISQSPAWYDLIMLHLQLAHVLHMIAHFSLKSTKPMTNLFESVTSRYFFQDMSDKVVLPWYHDDKRDNSRTEFLCRIITASMESIHQVETNGNLHLNSKQAVEWMTKCQTLAAMWKINNDQLRIHQVCQFYINAFDKLADEAFVAVNDTETLGTSLLPIAGKRMITFLSKSPDWLEEISRISPTFTQYLENLNTPEVSTTCSNENTIELIRKISRLLPETHNDYHIAQMMLDATFIYQSS